MKRIIKNSLITFAGLALLISALALFMPLLTKGQGGQAAGPNVLVVNTPAEPVPVRDVDKPARQPFQKRVSEADFEFTVPEGKRLVIEYFSATLNSSLNCEANIVLIRTAVTVSGEEEIVFHRFEPVRTSSLSDHLSQPTRIYADPNTPVRFLLDSNPNNCGANFSGGVSGYLVDVP